MQIRFFIRFGKAYIATYSYKQMFYVDGWLDTVKIR